MRKIIKKILKEEIDSRSERIKSIVNKYGIEQAIELIVGGIDTIKRAYQDNPASFLEGFNDLTPVQPDNIIYYVDNNRLPLFYYNPDKKNGYIYINYYRIWMFFEQVIGLKRSEIQVIIKKWLKETYNLRGLTPESRLLYFSLMLEETYNLRGLTPERCFTSLTYSWSRPII